MTKEQAAKTAAKWWADKLRRNDPHENGDNSPASLFANFLADQLVEAVTEEQLQTFRTGLELTILEDLNRFGSSEPMTDYHPSRNLELAARAAKISVNNFPFKVYVSIRPNRTSEGEGYTVRVKDGYGAPLQELKPVEGCEACARVKESPVDCDCERCMGGENG